MSVGADGKDLSMGRKTLTRYPWLPWWSSTVTSQVEADSPDGPCPRPWPACLAQISENGVLARNCSYPDGTPDHPGRATHGNRPRRDGFCHNRTRADSTAAANLGHHDCARPDPAIYADRDSFKYALFGPENAAFLVTLMLPAAAEDLNCRSDLGPVTNSCLPQHAVTADIDSAAHPGVRVRKKRAELNPAFEGAVVQCQTIVSNAKIIARQPRYCCTALSPEEEDARDSSEARHQCTGKGKGEKNRLKQSFQQRLQVIILPGSDL